MGLTPWAHEILSVSLARGCAARDNASWKLPNSIRSDPLDSDRNAVTMAALAATAVRQLKSCQQHRESRMGCLQTQLVLWPKATVPPVPYDGSYMVRHSKLPVYWQYVRRHL